MAEKNRSKTLKKRHRSRRGANPYRRFGGGHQRLMAGLEHLREVPRTTLFDRLSLVFVLLVAAVFTGLNIFHFPNYELDEGTYMGSAWAMFEQGNLSYYTYTYDHPLLGWFQIGLFSKLVGGFLAFGSSINTGRVMMLAVTVISTLLIFVILHRASGRRTAAVFGAVAFAVSPLGVALHRQVWLDNLLTLWLLVSIYTLVEANGRLWRIAVSAVAFGLAFWSKEVAVVFLPGMLYLTYVQSHPIHRRFALTLWSAITVTSISVFLLLALLKDEFFPPGVLGSSSKPHVSLLETFIYQANRGGNGSIFSPDSNFRVLFAQWTNADPLLMWGGLAAAALGFLLWRRDRFYFGVSLLGLFFMFLLVRGGVVLYFYVIPFLALSALSLGLLAGHAVNALGAVSPPWASSRAGVRPGPWRRLLRQPAVLVLLGLTVFIGSSAVPANQKNFTDDRTSSQNEASQWVASNLPNNSVILMDAYPWADLRDKALVGNKPFNNAHYPLTALQDPAVRSKTLRKPGSIDYFLYSPSDTPQFSWIDGRLNGRNLPLISQARKNSDAVRTFASGDWKMKILRVRNLHQIPAPEDPMLSNTWSSYKQRFIKNGRVIDPTQNNLTTSEGQSYAMLRAVYMNDQKTFDQVWNWSQENLQVRKGDALLAWKYGKTADGAPGVTDQSTATDADTDTALALLFASKQWNNPVYKQRALKIMGDVWNTETITAGSQTTGYKRVLVAGDWARGDSTGTVFQPVLNPSYFSPYAYRIFAKADPSRPWGNIVDSSYQILDSIQNSPDLGGKAGVVPNWVALDPATAQPVPANLEGLPTDQFSFDASRVAWRIGLDYMWFGDSRALQTLENLSLPRKQIKDTGRLAASYSLDGKPNAGYEATSAYAGNLSSLLVGGDPALAHKVFAEKILGAYTNGPGKAGAYWGKNPQDYYNQNMAWFATAIMDGSMGNLYAGEKVIQWDRTSIDTSLANKPPKKG